MALRIDEGDPAVATDDSGRPYGDLTRLNTDRTILQAVGAEALERIADDFQGLMGTSCAIYEKNGDYALGIFSSGWCKVMDECSYRLCKTEDPVTALSSGRWLCHESCWTEASLPSIQSGEAVDIPCNGGLHLFAEPIFAGAEVIGSINFGYGDPPDDPAELAELAEKYGVTEKRLKQAAQEHPHRSSEMIEEARRRLGNAARLIGLMVERHQAQQEARESADRYRLLFETMGQGVIYFDSEVKVVDANPAACRILGRTVAEMRSETGARDVEVVDEHGRPIPHDRLPAVRALVEGRRVSRELIGIRNPTDGKRRWLIGDGVPVEGSAESPGRRVYTVFSDITEQKEAEAALRESEERLRLSIQAANQGLYDLDLRTGEAVVSPVYATMLGYDPEDFRETNALWFDRLHPDDREGVGQVYKAYLAGEIDDYSVEFRQRTRNGQWKWIWSLGKIVERDCDGNPVRMMGTHTDIDDKKRAEERLRHSQKLESLGVLAGGIAHDFNNLLTSILGNADLADISLTPTHPAREFVENIETASQRAAELCRQMLAYAGKGRFVLDSLDLSEVVREMGKILQVSVSKKATLRYELAEGLPVLEADASQIRQVIMNLITNASDALEKRSGVISVTTGRMQCDHEYLEALVLGKEASAGPYVFLEVSDTGVGMDESTRELIFDPFFTTKFTGRGLGMAAMLGIVRSHKGAIRLYSEPGQGTTFKVLFPSVEGRTRNDHEALQQSDAWTGTGTVLLVDDEPEVRAVASRMLKLLGFDVVTAGDGMDALERYRNEPEHFTCVLLDLTMPRMGGEETFRALRRVREDVRVILSSGFNEQEVTKRFAGKGHAGFLQKPYTMNGLRSALQKTLS